MNAKKTSPSSSASSFSTYLAHRMSTNAAASTATIPSSSADTAATAADSKIFPMMSPSKSSAQQQPASEEPLIQRLQNQLQIIEKFFAFLPGSANILERKISQFEVMIAEFPAEAEKIADQWRDKVVSLWQRLMTSAKGRFSTSSQASHLTSTAYSPARSVNKIVFYSKSSLLGTPVASRKPEKPLKAASSQSLSPNTKSKGPVAAVKSNLVSTPAAVAARSGLLPPPPPQLQPQPQQSAEELQKQALRASLEKTFAELSDIHKGYGRNLDALKRLLIEVAKAQRELNRYPDDIRLQFTIFNVAFRKLPGVLREQFLAIYGVRQNGINLKNLIAFLQAEIVAQHSKAVWLLCMLAAKDRQNSASASVNQEVYQVGGSGNQRQPIVTFTSGRRTLGPVAPKWPGVLQGLPGASINCRYCKALGHTNADCPYIKELLCFQCYQYGHTKKGCTNEPLL